MNTTPTTDPFIRTRSTHAFALVRVDRDRPTIVDGRIVPGAIVGASIVGYAATNSPRVRARAERMSRTGSMVHVRPIVNGRVVAAS